MAVLPPFDNISDTNYFFLDITVGLNVVSGFPPTSSCHIIKVFSTKNNLLTSLSSMGNFSVVNHCSVSSICNLGCAPPSALVSGNSAGASGQGGATSPSHGQMLEASQNSQRKCKKGRAPSYYLRSSPYPAAESSWAQFQNKRSPIPTFLPRVVPRGPSAPKAIRVSQGPMGEGGSTCACGVV